MDNRDKIIKDLYELKSSISSEIFELENKLYLLRDSLDDINNEICKAAGHSFSDWKQVINPDWLNNTDDENIDMYCYKRKCSVCGKEEITFDKATPKIRGRVKK